jgi:hypothetical protein
MSVEAEDSGWSLDQGHGCGGQAVDCGEHRQITAEVKQWDVE